MKPIGFWLNRTDRALTISMNSVLAEFGLTRIAWQVLNVVTDNNPATESEVHTVLASNANRATLDAAITTVCADGWAERIDRGGLALTDDGRRRLAQVRERIAEFRDLSMRGITADEYRTAVSVLERMTRNVEGATD